MRVRFVLLATARAAVRFERELSMESCVAALSTTRGAGLSIENPSLSPSRFSSGGRTNDRNFVAR